MNTLKKYILKNKYYLAILVFALLLLIIQMKQVVLYADDFSLGIISKKGIAKCFYYFLNNYKNWGGGLTCLIATFFLMFRIGVWKVFTIALIILFIIITIKMIDVHNDKKKALLFLLGISCVFSLNIWISREVIYWLDGSLAYLLTSFQLFIYFYYSYTRISLKTSKKYDIILYPMISFFAGWSSAQSGPAAIIVPILLILFELMNKKNNIRSIKKINIICMLICILGFCIFYFAPGNNARMILKFSEFANYNLFEKILYRTETIYGLLFDIKKYQYTGIPFYLLISIGFINSLFYKIYKSSKLKYLSLPISLYIFICLVDKLKIFPLNISLYLYEYSNLLKKIDSINFVTISPYIIGSVIVILSIIEAYLISCKKNNPILVVSLSIAYITQFIMIMAPYSPLRTTIYTIMFLWIIILYLMKENIEDDFNIVGITAVAFALYDIKFLIIILLLAIFVKEYNKKMYNIFIIAIFILGICNYIDTTKNYNLNKKVYEENISRINDYKLSSKKELKELKLLLPNNEIYGFTPMVGYDWVEEDIKKYFELPKDLILIGEYKVVN